MTQAQLQEARMISEQLSVTEKIQLIEWLSVQLRQALDTPRQPADPDAQPQNGVSTNGHNHTHHDAIETSTIDASTDQTAATWTDEEIRAMMKPTPKTGAEIAAMLESGEIDTTVGRRWKSLMS
ncbi:MAG: hypothetical protein R2867_09115 [Caldilineaceae bacterium]